jgi:hypothetical protein
LTITINNLTADISDQDFFNYQLASIGDYIWLDINGDGIQNDGNTGINGVTVNLYDNTDPGNPILIASTATADDISSNPGYYIFQDLIPGDYMVVVDLASGPLSGLLLTTPGSISQTLVAGMNYPDADFGFVSPPPPPPPPPTTTTDTPPPPPPVLEVAGLAFTGVNPAFPIAGISTIIAGFGIFIATVLRRRRK